LARIGWGLAEVAGPDLAAATQQPRGVTGGESDAFEYFDPSFVRDDFVDIIRNNCWPE
jgi:hypothetical protein